MHLLFQFEKHPLFLNAPIFPSSISSKGTTFTAYSSESTHFFSLISSVSPLLFNIGRHIHTHFICQYPLGDVPILPTPILPMIGPISPHPFRLLPFGLCFVSLCLSQFAFSYFAYDWSHFSSSISPTPIWPMFCLIVPLPFCLLLFRL